MYNTLDALYYPFTICLDPTTLKYLLLLYDRIFYLPIDNLLNPGHDTLSRRWSMHDAVLHAAFTDPTQTARALMYATEHGSWDRSMRELMETYDRLEADGICVALKNKRFEAPNEWHPLQEAVDADLQDPDFVNQTRRVANAFLSMPPSHPGKAKGGGVALRPPRYQGALGFAELTSQRLNAALAFADAEGVVPVGTHPAFVSLFNAKLRRALRERGIDRDDAAFPQRSRARFSMLSWQVLSEVAPPVAIERRSVPEILKYREESREASQAFRAFLRQLESELNEDPWSDQSRDEIAGAVQRRVIPELQRVRQAKAEIWSKLFDETLTTLFSPKNVAAAAGVTLALHFMPGVSYVQLMSAGGGALLAELLPKLLVARRQEQEVRRNSLFFILRLQHR